MFSQYTRGTRVQHVRDNTRVVKPRGSLSGTLRGIPGGGERGPRVTRGHVGWKSTHGAWVWHAAWTPRGFEAGTPGLKSTHGAWIWRAAWTPRGKSPEVPS